MVGSSLRVYGIDGDSKHATGEHHLPQSLLWCSHQELSSGVCQILLAHVECQVAFNF